MPRARSKEDLIKASNEQYQKLTDLISSLSEKELNTEFDFSDDSKKTERHWGRDKNLRDIYIHLYEWHQLLLNWIKANDLPRIASRKKTNFLSGATQAVKGEARSGEEKPFIPEPYSWKTYGDMNCEFWEKHQKTSLEDAKKMFEKSHAEVLKLAESYTNDQLFGRGVYAWVNTDLGSYFVSVMPSHYDWAMKKLKAHRKNCENE